MGLLGNLYCETIAFQPQSSTDDLQTLFFGKSIVRKVPLSFIEYYTDPPHVISTFIMLGVYYYKGYEVVQLPPDSRTVVREACFQYPEGTEFDAKASDSHRLLQFTSLDAFKCSFPLIRYTLFRTYSGRLRNRLPLLLPLLAASFCFGPGYLPVGMLECNAGEKWPMYS